MTKGTQIRPALPDEGGDFGDVLGGFAWQGRAVAFVSNEGKISRRHTARQRV